MKKKNPKPNDTEKYAHTYIIILLSISNNQHCDRPGKTEIKMSWKQCAGSKPCQTVSKYIKGVKRAYRNSACYKMYEDFINTDEINLDERVKIDFSCLRMDSVNILTN